jgi:hypothetical protein
LAVERLTALGERDSAVRDTEPRAGVALLPIRYLDELVRCHLQWAAWRDSQPSSFNNRSISASAAANDARLCAA